MLTYVRVSTCNMFTHAHKSGKGDEVRLAVFRKSARDKGWYRKTELERHSTRLGHPAWETSKVGKERLGWENEKSHHGLDWGFRQTQGHHPSAS